MSDSSHTTPENQLLSERTAREILNALQVQYGSLHRLRAAHRLMHCAEAMLELCDERHDRRVLP
jgi:hypothetical protein